MGTTNYEVKYMANDKECDPRGYMTKEECEHEHKIRAEKYSEVINTSIADRNRIATDLSEYKNKINGKFDKIIGGLFLVFITVICSLIATIWSGHVSSTGGKERFDKLSEIIQQQQKNEQARDILLSSHIDKLERISKGAKR